MNNIEIQEALKVFNQWAEADPVTNSLSQTANTPDALGGQHAAQSDLSANHHHESSEASIMLDADNLLKPYWLEQVQQTSEQYVRQILRPQFEKLFKRVCYPNDTRERYQLPNT